MRVALVGALGGLGEALSGELRGGDGVDRCALLVGAADECAARLRREAFDAVVYLAADRARGGLVDPADARAVLAAAGGAAAHRLVVSSSAVHEPGPHHPGMVAEEPLRPLRRGNRISRAWRALESEAAAACAGAAPAGVLTVARVPAVAVPGGRDFFSRRLAPGLVAVLPGHDPPFQVLTPGDLAEGLLRLLDARPAGVFQLAPPAAVPLRRALRAAGAGPVPVPRWLQAPVRAAGSRLGLCAPADQLDFFRYSWTASGERARATLGWAPQGRRSDPPDDAGGDDFGMDRRYIDALGRGLFRFLHDRYWRVETTGLENVPPSGRAMLVGMHRGFMPFDGVMVLHLLARRLGRYPRFLVHPGLLVFPFFHDFIIRLGGMLACRENAERVLAADELLGFFPEGVRGAFRRYRDAYRLGRFSRDEFVKIALRHRAPIVPFVTLGSAETFPIFGAIRWRWWQRRAEWPFIPITPTFPFLPLPLPSKWHIRFLEPIRPEPGAEAAAGDPAAVRAVSDEVRARMQAALDSMLARRRSIFRGSIF